MVILGIDVGSITLGYAILSHKNFSFTLVECGALKFKKTTFKEKILELSEFIDDLFTRISIDEVAIESLFFGYNPKSVLTLSEFKGALSLKILQIKGDYFEYSPLEIKSSLTGNGKASKEQVSFMVRKILNIKQEIKPYDITDAIAIAITHQQRRAKIK